jgi:hypothetical protein
VLLTQRRQEAIVPPDLDALLTALYVYVDDSLPSRCGPGRPPRMTDAEFQVCVRPSLIERGVSASLQEFYTVTSADRDCHGARRAAQFVEVRADVRTDGRKTVRCIYHKNRLGYPEADR